MSTHWHSTSKQKYGWVIVGVSAIMLSASVLSTSAISVFIKALSAEFGWHRGPVSFIFFASMMGLAMGGIFMGRLADRSSTRLVTGFGAVVIGVCLILLAQAQFLWQFYLLFFLAAFFGTSTMFAPLIANVGNWFDKNVGLALGLATSGQALGQGAVLYGTAILVSEHGWRDALTTMGIIAFAVLVPLSILIRDPSSEPKTVARNSSATDMDAPVPLSPNIVIAWLSFAVVFCCICMSVPLAHVIPMAQDQGIPLDDASGIMFILLLAAVLGRIAFGKLADLVGPLRSYWIAACWQTVLVFFFVRIDSVQALNMYAFIWGFGYAGVMTGIVICVRVMIPLARRATALGIVTFFGWFGHGVGGYQGGLLFDLTDDYTLSFAIAALAGVVNLIVVAALYFTLNRHHEDLVTAQ
jgi:MFS family permease